MVVYYKKYSATRETGNVFTARFIYKKYRCLLAVRLQRKIKHVKQN